MKTTPRPALLALALILSLAASASAQAQPTSLAAELDALAQTLAAEDAAPGVSIAVVQGPDTLLMKGYGYAVVEHQVPATAETVYRIGSITKQFTSAAVMRLVEQGQVNLDDPLPTVITDYPTTGQGVTVHHLLNHTSGIPSYTGLGPKFWDQSRLDLTHDQMLDLFKDEPLEFDPGAQWSYNNSGYYLLGVLLEEATGATYPDHLAETLFEPLGLAATSYCYDAPIIPHRAAGYAMDDDALVHAAPLSMNAPFSAGALCSSVEDLLTWQKALVTGQVVSPNAYTLMTTPTQLADGTEQGYGYGLGVDEGVGGKRIAHGGGINGFSTFLSYYPAHDLSIVVLTNSGQGNPGRIESRLARKVFGILEPIYTEIELAPDVLERYVGVYEIAPTFKITITREGSQLKAEATGQSRVDLFAFSETEFFLKVVEAQVSFHVNDQGEVEGLTMHQNGSNTPGKKVE